MTTKNYWQERNDPIIKAFRANNGRLDGQGRGRSLLLLTTTGARSGQPRVAPLAFTHSGEHYAVIAVEVGGETFRARARVAEGDEHDTLFEAQAREMPNLPTTSKRPAARFPWSLWN